MAQSALSDGRVVRTRMRMLRALLIRAGSLGAGLLALAAVVRAADAIGPATQPITAASIPFAASTTAPSTQPLDSAAAARVAQLDSDDWHTRQQAEDQLVAQGESVRSQMRGVMADASRSEETRSRAAAVIARLDQAAANSPTLITLNAVRENPREVLDELARQAHTTLTYMPDSLWGPQFPVAPKVTLELHGEPFWSAISQVCKQANARVQPNGSMNALMVMSGNFGGDLMDGPQSTNGLFTVTAVSASLNRQVSFNPNARGGFNNARDEIRFALFADPKVRLIEADSMAVLTQADDDKGRSMLPPPEAQPFFRNRLFGFGGTFSARLQYPNDGYSKLTRLKGSLHVMMADRTERLELPDVSQSLNKPHSVVGWTVRIDRFETNDSGGALRMHVQFPDGNPNPLLRALQDVRLTDASGMMLVNGVGGNLLNNGNAMDCQTSFNVGKPVVLPVKLTWDVVTQSKAVAVPFTFTDLPMPMVAP